MEAFLTDLRQATRALSRNPGFTVAAVFTLGLGMGATTAIYTLLKRVVIDPLPYPQPERLVRLKNQVPGSGTDAEWDVSTAQYFHFREHAKGTFATVGLYQRAGANVASQGAEPHRASTAVVTSSLLELLGARPALGRLFGPADDAPGTPYVVVLSYEFWRARFGGDSTVIGRNVTLSGTPREIIGVMAAGVDLPQEQGAAVRYVSDLWTPMRLNPAGPFYNNHVFRAVARLAPNATLARGEAEIAGLTPGLIEAFPIAYSAQFFERYRFHTVLRPLKEYVVGDAARNLWMLFGAVGLVLAIACANVVNLLVVRLESRRRERAVRAALGASRGALARHGFAECLVLGAAGGGLGLTIGFWSLQALIALAPEGVPQLADVQLDLSVLAFAAGLVLLVALALAAVPWLQRNQDGRTALASGGRSSTLSRERRRLSSALVAGQIALALVLVIGSALLLQSFRRLRNVDPGFDPAGGLSVQLNLPSTPYDSVTRMWRFYDAAVQRVRGLPGVANAGVAVAIPLTGNYGCTVQGFEDQAVYARLREAGTTTCAALIPTSPGFMETLRQPLLAGRFLTQADHDNPAVGAVVVSKAFADKFWPGENPLGKGVKPFDGRPPFYHVVGVVGDVRGESVDEPPAIVIYYPMVALPAQPTWWPSSVSLVLRTDAGDPMDLLPSVQRAVREIDPTIPVAGAITMETVVDRSMARLSFIMGLLGVAAGVALVLASVGVYGVTSYIVARRTSEIGIRMALGARRQQVERAVLRDSLVVTGAGLVVGLAGAAALTRMLEALLHGVPARDPIAFGGAALVLAAVATLAGWIPARRAARVDPNVALRYE